MRTVTATTAMVILAALAGMLIGCGSKAPEGGTPAGEPTQTGKEASTGKAAGQEQPAPVSWKTSPQKVCPVLGNPIDRSVYIDYKDKRIYFCCPPCIETFKKDPEKYLKIMKDQGVEPEPIP